MPNAVISNFYHRLLPLYAPRAEELLKTAHPEDMRKLNFRYIFTVKGMIDISYLIEDAVTENPGVAETHVSFQYMSRFAQQAERYAKVAEASNGLWLYGAFDAELPPLPKTTLINTDNTALLDYWYIVAYGPGISMTLLAEEIVPENPIPGESRLYEGFYTFDPDTAYQLLRILHQSYPQDVSAPIPPERLEN